TAWTASNRDCSSSRSDPDIDTLRRRSDYRNTVDLDRNVARKPRGLNGGTGRWRGTEEGRVHSIHFCEVAHVSQKHRRLHDALRRAAGSFNNGNQVLQHAASLTLNGLVVDNTSRGGINRDLAGNEKQISRADRLRIRTDSGGCLRGRDDVFVHGCNSR